MKKTRLKLINLVFFMERRLPLKSDSRQKINNIKHELPFLF